MKHTLLLIVFFLAFPLILLSNTYQGRVVDEQGHPVLYATVYLQENPVIGTATNASGLFSLTVDSVDDGGTLIISYVGYEKLIRPLCQLDTSLVSYQLVEQPITLEETIVEAKKTHRSKRKLLAEVLHQTYLRLEETWPKSPISYHIVSDVKMDAQSSPWGMEQMIARVTEIPSTEVDQADSVQFEGEYCKRYCAPEVRIKIDSVMRHEKNGRMRNMATAIDSGTVVHRSLWKMRLQRNHLLDTEDELSHWRLSKDGDSQCVLTYTTKKNYFGIVKAQIVENLIVDAYDFTAQSYTLDLSVQLFLPFSIKFKGTELEWINLLNMNNASLEKFRLKRGNVHSQISTLYEMRDGIVVPVEKNMHTTALFEDNRHNQLPCEVYATQHVVDIKTTGVKTNTRYNKNHLVERVLVPIY